MSVLTLSGPTALPHRSLGIDHSRSASASSTRPSHAPYAGDVRSLAAAAAAATGVPLHTAPTTQPDRPRNTHRHSRTVSSTILPAHPVSAHTASPRSVASPASPRPAQTHVRQASIAGMQTGAGAGAMHRQNTTGSWASIPRRSTSSRSTGTTAPTSYVALMRKQKATVWCDRSQNINQQQLVAQRAAKKRAALEVQGALATSARTNTVTSGGVVGKIRHGGVPKAPGYTPANLSGAGVPMRLSANEMLADDEVEPRHSGDNAMLHARSGSGKSSTSSSQYRSGYPRADQARVSLGVGLTTSAPDGDASSPAPGGIPELAETADPARPAIPPAASEDDFGDVPELAAPRAWRQTTPLDRKAAEDLRRRGSVDERAMSMGAGVRLFVANPDLDD